MSKLDMAFNYPPGFVSYDVDSSQIKQIAYHSPNKVMMIKFHNDDVYRYENVGIETWTALKNSGSIGRFFHANIKNKKEHKAVKVHNGKSN